MTTFQRSCIRARLLIGGALLTLAACSSGPFSSGKNAQEIASTGPTVLRVDVNPHGTIELNQALQPTTRAEVIAEVKDFQSTVTDVRLRFSNVPLEIPLQHVSGSTWRATLTPGVLKKLAVNGQTERYSAKIIAKNSAGMSSAAPDAIQIAVKTPDIGKTTG